MKFLLINLEVENFDLASNGLIAYVLNNAGFSDLYVFNPQTGYNTLIKMEPRGVLSSVLWNPEGTQLVFNFSAATSPLDVHVWDSKTKGVTQWTECRPRSMDWKNFAQPEEIKWKSLDTEITGLLYISKKEFKTSSKKRPVVINVHGGPRVNRDQILLVDKTICSTNWGCASSTPMFGDQRVLERNSCRWTMARNALTPTKISIN